MNTDAWQVVSYGGVVGSALGNIRASNGSTAASIAKEVSVSTTMPAKTESTLRIMERESTGRREPLF